MTPIQLLDQLKSLDVEIWLDGDRLRLSAPEGVLTAELQEQLRARRDELIAFLRTAREAAAARSMIPLQATGSKPAFFGIPGHGGDVFNFVPLARALGTEQPFFACQPPGVDEKEAPLERIEALADHFLAELRAAQPEGPYQIGGYCTGGLIAFEAARRLAEGGEHVAALVLFGSSSPSSNTLTHRVRTRPVRALNRAIRFYRERVQGAPREAEPPDDANRLRVEKATTIAVRRYTAPDPYPGRIVLFIPSDNWRGMVCERYRDWSRLAGGGLRIHAGPPGGIHRTMLREPDVALVAERLRAELD